MLEGVIIKGIGGLYTVNTDEGRYNCRARGVFRKENISPLVGDKVLMRVVDQEKKEGYLHSILVRRNKLIRPSVTNVDQVCLVYASKSPKPDFDLIDQIILSCLSKNINVILCENKIDLVEENEENKITPYENAGFETFKMSMKHEDDLSKLLGSFKEKITVFAGQSGVGKSSIINHIMNKEMMEIGDISKKTERGKHTTRHAELIELKNGGYIIDTPGFSNFEIDDIDYQILDEYYPEFEPYLYSCKFSGCTHIHEPGCKIKQAVDNGEIDNERYLRYVKIYELLKNKEDNKFR